MKKKLTVVVPSVVKPKISASTTKKGAVPRARMKALLSRSVSLAQGLTNSTPISIITKDSDAIKESKETRRGLDNTAIFHSIRKILGKEYWDLGNPNWRINGVLIALWFPGMQMTKMMHPAMLKIYYGKNYPSENKYGFRYLCRSFPAHTEAAREACHYVKRYGKIP